MSPALEPGEYLLAVKPAPGRLPRGALVVVEHPERPGFEMVKRLEGLPGDRIADRTLGPQEYWVLGDNPRSSTDSRSFGAIGPEAVLGVVRLRYWPLGRTAWFPQWAEWRDPQRQGRRQAFKLSRFFIELKSMAFVREQN
jgi:nickel-type superoxide dismutase maturation protease